MPTSASIRLGVLAFLVSLTGCEGISDSTPSPSHPSNLVIESSMPEREITLTNTAAVSSDMRSRQVFLSLAQDTTDLHHRLSVVWDARSQEILSVSHEVMGWWDYGDGYMTSCQSAQCLGAVVIDEESRTATFTGLTVVSSGNPVVTSTLDGTVGW